MVHITPTEANAWLEGTKLNVSSVDATVDTNAFNIVVGRLAAVFDTSGWTTETNTPSLVRTLISMYYVSYLYDRAYADDASDTSNYAFILRRQADFVVNGLLTGAVILAEDPEAANELMDAAFFPNDASSARCATREAPSDGPAAFTMGMQF